MLGCAPATQYLVAAPRKLRSTGEKEGAEPKLRAPPASTTRERQPSPLWPISMRQHHALAAWLLNDKLSGWLPRFRLDRHRGNAKPRAVAGTGPRCWCKQPLPEANSRCRILAVLQSPVTPGSARAFARFLSTRDRCTNINQSLKMLLREPAPQHRPARAVPPDETLRDEKTPANSVAWQHPSALARRLQLLSRCKQPNCRR